MAPSHFSFIALFAFLSLLNPCYCQSLNVSDSLGWLSGGATWYGEPNGAGSNGGACGYQDAVGKPPFSSMVAAGNPTLFKGGKGCGACYQVKCTSNSACSGHPVTVVITDSCPGGPCLAQDVHFDMSGTAFGRMAVAGQADRLRGVGVLSIQYQRVWCKYPGYNIAFHVDAGSNPYYFAVLIEFEDKDGDLGGVDIKVARSNVWMGMTQSSGAVWMLNAGSQMQPPFSLRLRSLTSGQTVVATNAIPLGWQAGKTYLSRINLMSF